MPLCRLSEMPKRLLQSQVDCSSDPQMQAKLLARKKLLALTHLLAGNCDGMAELPEEIIPLARLPEVHRPQR